MRVYLPVAPTELTGRPLAPRTAYAVTPALARALPEEDAEGHEASAYLAACDAAVELAGEGGRRVVVAADVTAADVTAADLPLDPGAHPGEVNITAPVPWRDVASIHADEPAAAPDVRAAAGGDAEALERAAERDLLWYDPSERADLADELGIDAGGAA